MNFNKNLFSIDLANMDTSELEDVTISLSKNFVQLLNCLKNGEKNAIEMLLICIKHLKLLCTKGPSFQNLIINTREMLDSIKGIVNSDSFDDELKIKSFQLLANLSVQNERSQKKIWIEDSDQLLEKLKSDDLRYANVAAMIIYNIILGKIDDVDVESVLKNAMTHYDSFLKNKSSSLPDFIHILLDYFICTHVEIIDLYGKLDAEQQKVFLCYIHDHIENESNEAINERLLKHLIIEFKRKSDCILKTVSSYIDLIDPEIVVILLDIISTITAQQNYLDILQNDSSLFLNIGCLLQALVKLGKNLSTNVFSPIQKLEALATTSNENADFEKDFSFTFKSKLVKSLANLSYRNKRNQELAREMEIMQSVFECTNADARNPLIKEWSILAIRNLCEDNMENQNIVYNLTNIGNAENPILTEFGIDDGVFRIKKNS